MEHSLAKEIINELIVSQKKYDELLQKIKSSSSKNEFDFYKKGFGKLMGNMLLDIINPILKEYPDLKPEGLNEI